MEDAGKKKSASLSLNKPWKQAAITRADQKFPYQAQNFSAYIRSLICADLVEELRRNPALGSPPTDGLSPNDVVRLFLERTKTSPVAALKSAVSSALSLSDAPHVLVPQPQAEAPVRHSGRHQGKGRSSRSKKQGEK